MTKQRAWMGMALCALAGGWLAVASQAADEKEQPGLLYELRTYTAHDGKMADLNKRFSDHTMKLFEKHGMKNIAYWTPVDKENTLVYVIAHKSAEAAEKSWKDFIADPEWQAAYKKSHENGPLVAKVEKQYLTPTEYSPMK